MTAPKSTIEKRRDALLARMLQTPPEAKTPSAKGRAKRRKRRKSAGSSGTAPPKLPPD